MSDHIKLAAQHMTRRGIKKYMAWLDHCRDTGWTKAQMPMLAQLWLDYHDENGEAL